MRLNSLNLILCSWCHLFLDPVWLPPPVSRTQSMYLDPDRLTRPLVLKGTPHAAFDPTPRFSSTQVEFDI